ncbi:MAG: nucleoside monophosphate kinase [Polyangiaceae bacterium]
MTAGRRKRHPGQDHLASRGDSVAVDRRHAPRGQGQREASGGPRRGDGVRRAGPGRRGRGLIEERAPRRRLGKPGFLLDGFPRTVPQAEAADKMLVVGGPGSRPRVAIEVPDELLVERATLRRTDKRTGQIYHLKYNPPPPDAELEHRGDDHEEVVRNRLATYSKMTADLLPFYGKRGGLLKRVHGVGAVDEVTHRVLAAIGLQQK